MDHSMHNPVLIVIAGPNGSGKTSVTSKILHHEWMEDAVYINPDIIAQEKFGNWNSKEAVMQAVKYCEELREQCLVERKSLIFETVLSVEDKIDYILRAKEVGFFIRFFFVCTEHPTINAARIARRVMEGGHDVPITKIISRYDKSIANSSIVSEFVDRAYIYDNSIEDVDAQLLFRLKDGKLVKQYVDVIPRWALAIYDKRDD
ncbi:zeta toxin family protein [uncultured Bacteroides sp.]|uniref:zeta toxin family protein n=1 Tax=uncultured Bacteroides sp. TaxID=162156 RepID=UPI0025F59B20|nr:zeta toxin family protein [uncultured Bacteroides sp.]